MMERTGLIEPAACIPHSIALNEAVYTELYHMVRTSGRAEVNMTNFVQKAAGLNSIPTKGIIVDLTLACMRFGKELDLRYIVMAGIDRLATVPSDFLERPTVTVSDPRARDFYNLGVISGDTAPLNILDYAPVTYPSLSYGVNEDDFYLNKNSSEVTFTVDARSNGIVFTDPEKFSAFMSTMRLFGYDVNAMNLSTGKIIKNWADNASGRYIYVHDADDLYARFVIRVSDIKPREHCHIALPSMYGNVTMKYSLEGATLTWFSGEQRQLIMSMPAKAVSRSDYTQAVSRLLENKTVVKLVPLVKTLANFQRAEYSLPTSRPILAPTSGVSVSGPTITEQEEEGVYEPAL